MKNTYHIDNKNNIVYIDVKHRNHGDLSFIIDYTDFEEVSSIKGTWFLGFNKNRFESIKTKIQNNSVRQNVLLHRLIMKPNAKSVVDHINGNIFDNRRSNLRCVTAKENASNISPDSKYNKTSHTNIYFEKGKYGVRINNKRYGRFDNINDAIEVRDNIIKDVFPLRRTNEKKEDDVLC